MLRAFTSPACDRHRVGRGFPERPERLAAVLEGLEATGVAIEEVAAGESARPTVEALHDSDYVARFERAVRRGDGLLDSADNPLSPGTWEAAWGAVSAALAAADWVMQGEDRCGFVAARPPGHHAERSTAMGFCYLNTAAIVAEHLRRRHELPRVAIFDFDVHHGNGTQHLFEERADVLYASTHQWPFYPGTGAASERGGGDGEGATLNVPLAAGADDEVYAAAIEERVIPAVESFRPTAVVLSAGFDAWRDDPLGGMRVSRDGFRSWGRRLAETAARWCDGRIVAVLEGGYDVSALGDLVSAHLEGVEDGLSRSEID